jgi:HD-like signal output (HDOD) protein
MTLVTADQTRQSALKALDKLPALSPTVGQMLGVLAQSVPDIHKLERLINKDPVMAGTLLSVANSAMYSRHGSASSTIDAIVRLGYSKLKRFALAQTFARVFRFGRPASVWSPTRFHLHSSAVGMAGELLADRLPVVNGENAFLAGLVHDLGKLLIAVAMPEQWQRVDSYALHGGNPMEKEIELLGIDHAELSALAARKWNLPAPVFEAVRQHHRPLVESTHESIPLCRLVQAADTFVNSLGISVISTKPEGDPVPPAFNGYDYDTGDYLSQFQEEWNAMSSLCF